MKKPRASWNALHVGPTLIKTFLRRSSESITCLYKNATQTLAKNVQTLLAHVRVIEKFSAASLGQVLIFYPRISAAMRLPVHHSEFARNISFPSFSRILAWKGEEKFAWDLGTDLKFIRRTSRLA